MAGKKPGGSCARSKKPPLGGCAIIIPRAGARAENYAKFGGRGRNKKPRSRPRKTSTPTGAAKEEEWSPPRSASEQEGAEGAPAEDGEGAK